MPQSLIILCGDDADTNHRFLLDTFKVFFIAPTGNPRKKIQTLFHATRDNVHRSYQSVIDKIGALSSNPCEPTSEDVDEVFQGVRETLDWQVLAWLGLRVSKANSLRLREHPVEWSETSIIPKYQPGLKQTYGDGEGDLKTFLKKKREDETQGTFALNVGWFTTYDLLNRLDKISDAILFKNVRARSCFLCRRVAFSDFSETVAA